mgnify:CR=1 FL=1
MKEMLKILFFTCLILVVCPQAGTASRANKTATLEEMTVTAERFSVREKESSKYVEIYSAQDLKDTGGNNLIDALRRAGGLSYKAYGPMGMKSGMGSKVSIRGVENGELILINGMPIQNAGSRNYRLSNIPVEFIERVEIIKGSASVQHGSNAMSGVINIITKKNVDRQEVSMSTEYGDYQYQKHKASYLGPNVNLGVSSQHLNSMKQVMRDYEDDEYKDTTAFDQYMANLNANLSKNLYFDLLGSFVDSGYENYNSNTHQIKESNDYEGNELVSNLRYELQDTKVKAFYKYADQERNTYEYDPGKQFDERSEYYHFNSGFSVDHKLSLYTVETKIGTEYIHRAIDHKSKYGYHYRNDYALFVNLSKTFLDRLKLDLGMRGQFVDADSDGEDQEEFTPSLGLNYRVNDCLNLFADTAKSFRVPTFNNLYYDSWLLEGNPDLSPEQGWTYQGGVKFGNRFSHLRLAGFFMDYQDKIESHKPEGGYPYVYYNAGDYKSVGMDWDLELTPFASANTFARYIAVYTSGTWCDPSAEDPEGNDYQTGPKFDSAVGAKYNTPGLSLGLHTNLKSGRPDNLDNTSTLNITGNYKLPKGSLTFALNNVFDQEVEINGDKKNDNYVYYGMPRFFKVGYEISY